MDYPPHKSGAQEVTEAIASGLVASIPGVGGALQVVLDMVLNREFRQRSGDFLWYVADGINRLQEQVDSLPKVEELGQHEDFLDAVFQATRAAQATHDREKLKALRNAVLNTLLPGAPDADEQARFIRLVDQFRPSHLRLLRFLQDPGGTLAAAGVRRPEITMGPRSAILEALPEFTGRRPWYDLLMGDLTAASLTAGQLSGMMSLQGLWAPAISDLGNRFLAFVTSPLPDEDETEQQ